LTSADSPILGSKQEALSQARRLLLRNELAKAEQQARIIVEGDPQDAEAYRILGMALRRAGRIEEARFAETQAIELAMLQPVLFEAAMALVQLQLDKVERALRPYLRQQPDDAAALRMLAEVGARTGHLEAAEQLLQRAIAVAPDYSGALALRKAIARLKGRTSAQPASTIRPTLALEDELGAEEQNEEALKLYAQVVRRFPESADNWVSYGHVLRAIGRQDDAVANYRIATAVRPTCGEAWYAIADLKAGRFTDADIAQLRDLVASQALADEDRIQLEFALGRALEQFGNTADAFAHYCTGNSLRAARSNYNADAIQLHVDRSISVLTRTYFERRVEGGEPSPDPIFILGMPRAGSTLIEQIVSSHPQVEAVGELSDIPHLANGLAKGGVAAFDNSAYLDNLLSLTDSEVSQLGRSYIWSTGLRRRTTRPFFVDKMPNNWLHIGLILSILPNAKLIDARRHPMACGFSNYRQYFAHGQEFSYDLSSMGRFYRDYERMMCHFDEVIPDRIYRVMHEELVRDPEGEIKRLLAYLSLEFDDRCLRFYENRRTVRTASSEQVRRPINTEGLAQWRAFEAWLGPLRDALGPLGGR
jgi:tetratricopeptide (TPR) repeat protein